MFIKDNIVESPLHGRGKVWASTLTEVMVGFPTGKQVYKIDGTFIQGTKPILKNLSFNPEPGQTIWVRANEKSSWTARKFLRFENNEVVVESKKRGKITKWPLYQEFL